MKTLSIAFPILPGKTDEARQFARDAMANAGELAQSFARVGIVREQWFMQHTPTGDIILVTMEAEDPHKAMRDWALSRDPFDCWFKAQAQAVSGIDFNQPIAALPERVFAWEK